MGNFCEDFDNPIEEEKEKISTLLKELNDLGIKAFTCIFTQHLLVFYKDPEGNQMTPSDFARVLKDERVGPEIKAALQKACQSNANPPFNAEKWAENFIKVYEDGSEHTSSWQS